MIKPKQQLTEKQQEMLKFLRDFAAEEDRMPSTHETRSHFGFASQTAVVGYFLALCRKGHLEHRTGPGSSRGWWRFAR